MHASLFVSSFTDSSLGHGMVVGHLCSQHGIACFNFFAKMKPFALSLIKQGGPQCSCFCAVDLSCCLLAPWLCHTMQVTAGLQPQAAAVGL